LALGRDPGCEVRFHPVDDAVVSRNHALIEWESDDPPVFRIVDLLSSNGTFVNGRRIGRSALLRAGDVVRLGHGGPEFVFGTDTFEHDGVAQDPGVRAPQTMEIPLVTVRQSLPKIK
jgi:pSer/pThr/pTyr-binding forkhead associated (FHA) protein